jgi:hypothetical protein
MTIKNKPVDYKQYDAKWASIDYSAVGEVNTIKSAGCGITCSAMVIATLKNKSITPVDTAKWSKSRGYKIKAQGTAYSYFKPQLAEYGINCTMMNSTNVYKNKSAAVHKTVLSELQKGNWIIAVMGVGRWTKGGHYVLCYAYDSGLVYINDSASIANNRLVSKIEDWQYEVKYYWKVEIPEAKKVKIIQTETPSSTSTTSKFDNVDWLKRLQKEIGAKVTGLADEQTLKNTPTVKRGDKNNVVKLIQEKLKAIGIDPKGVDGSYGKDPYTGMYNSVIEFQKSNVGLKKPDGEFTSKLNSWKTLLSVK